jgi:hypothetical protein
MSNLMDSFFALDIPIIASDFHTLSEIYKIKYLGKNLKLKIRFGFIPPSIQPFFQINNKFVTLPENLDKEIYISTNPKDNNNFCDGYIYVFSDLEKKFIVSLGWILFENIQKNIKIPRKDYLTPPLIQLNSLNPINEIQKFIDSNNYFFLLK